MAIRILNRQKKVKLDLKRAGRSASSILRESGAAGREVNVLITDDDGIREINRSYLHRDRPTNVISFAMQEGEPGAGNPESENLLGDVIISVETARRDADAGGLTLDQEIDFLMIHGILHLLGYDHVKNKTEAARMMKKEKEIFFALNGFDLQ